MNNRGGKNSVYNCRFDGGQYLVAGSIKLDDQGLADQHIEQIMK